jgi:hypothetical protein
VLAVFVFYMFDDDVSLLIHLLLRNFKGKCFFDYATATNCRLVVAKNTSRNQKQKHLIYFKKQEFSFSLYVVVFVLWLPQE